MLITYTKKELARIFNVSPRTIEDDSRYLGIKPTTGDRNTNLYSESDYDLIEQLREHCKNKANSRDTFIPKSKVEILPDIANTERISLTKKTKSIIKNYAESLEVSLQHDPLFDLELLQRVSDRKWLLPANRLAPLFGISAKYLSSKKTYDYCGFVASREIKANNEYLYKVEANNS